LDALNNVVVVVVYRLDHSHLSCI